MTADGFTLAQKAVVEHNIVAIGRIYINIYLTELAKMLDLEAELTERLVSKMIAEDRLSGFINQSGIL